MQYGSIPMQSNHMKQNYAAYLSNNFPMVIILKSLGGWVFPLEACRPHLFPGFL